MDVQVLDQTVGSSHSIKYLGVHFDKDLRMKVHVEETAKKAGRMVGNLSRLMPNIGGPACTKRRVLGAVVNSILLYAAPIWYKTLETAKYQKIYEKIQRQMTIRIGSAYRTVSTAAMQVLTGSIPIDLMARERSLIYDRGKEEVINIREETLELWQDRWDSETRGRWTWRLVPDVRRWKERKHGELDFHLTQVLSGHGCFEAYLHKIGKRRSAECHYCHQEDDTAEHTLFRCPRWTAEREETERSLRKNLDPDNLAEAMLSGEEDWKEVKKMANSIMRQKEEDEKKMEEERRGAIPDVTHGG